MGQRILFSLLVLVLLVVGALLGHPGQYPALASGDPTAITPDSIFTLVGQIIAPLVLLGTILIKLFNAINARVVEGTLDPKDVLKLFTLPEFWTAAIGAAAGILEVFFPNFILTPEQQALLANGIMAVVTALLNSLGQRANRAALPTVLMVEGKATRVVPRS